MKNILILILIVFPFLINGQIVEIQKDKIYFDGKPVDSVSTIREFVQILGEPTKVDNYQNLHDYYFDKNGIEISTDSLNRINNIEFKLTKRQQLECTSKGLFKGHIFIPDLDIEICKNTGYRALKRKVQHSTNIDQIDIFAEKFYFGEHLNTNDNLESTDFDNEDKTTDFKYGIYRLDFEHNYFQTHTQLFTISFIKPQKRIKRLKISELDTARIFSFINSVFANDTISFNLQETATLGMFNSDFDYIKDTVFSKEDGDFIKQQLILINEFKWEQGKIKGANIIPDEKIHKIFKHKKGWDKFNKKFGNCLTEFSLPIFSKNYDYCIFYSWEQCHYLAGGGNISLYKFVNSKWVFVKTYSFGIS